MKSSILIWIIGLITGVPGCDVEHFDSLQPRGLISSPRYPIQPNRRTCKLWYINGRPEDVITLSFRDLDIATSNNRSCPQGYLHLGPSPEIKLCGTIGNYSYQSSKTQMWIVYNITDTSLIQGRGFQLEYQIGPGWSQYCDEDQCADRKCIPRHWRCNGVAECADESDEKFCGTINQPTLPEFACESAGFGCVLAKDNQYRCVPNNLMCDGVVHCKDALDEKSCAHGTGFVYLTDPSGNITSANYPGNYPPNTRSQYMIHVDAGRQVQLRFQDFRLGTGDALFIFDGPTENFPLIGGSEFGYHSHPPAVLTSSNDTVLLVFRANNDNSESRGFNITYQIKGECLNHQRKCEFGEWDCYDATQHCDGKWDCPLHGGDERGCRTCANHLFSCRSSSHCYQEKDHCNGLHFCPDKSDEENCTPDKCGHDHGTFLCKNKRCIYESWVCDRADDCKDNSDEKDCSSVPTRKVITAAVLGSLLCALLLVIAIGCTCKLHARRMNQMLGGYARYMSPMSRVEEEIWARQSAPPLYDEAMRTSRPFDEAQREFMQALQQAIDQRAAQSNGQQAATNSTSTDSPNQNNNAQRESDGEDDAMLDLENEAVARDVRPEVDNTSIDDASGVLLTMTTGVKAQWRRTQNKKRSRGSGNDDGSCSSTSADDVTPLQLLNCDTSVSDSTNAHTRRDTNIDSHNTSNNKTTTPHNKAMIVGDNTELLQTRNVAGLKQNLSISHPEIQPNDNDAFKSDDNDEDDEMLDEDDLSNISQNSLLQAHHPDAGRLLESFVSRPLDGASVSDVSLADSTEHVTGHCDVTMLSP